MAEPTYDPAIGLIVDGEPDSAAVVNRPLQALAGDAAYLKERLDAAELGQAIAAAGAPFSAAVRPDMAVAYNPSTQRFEPALAAVVVDPATGLATPAALAACVGICGAKDTATSGTIVLAGRWPTTLAGAVVGTPTPGLYALSSAVPGGLVAGPSPAGSPVLYWDGTYAYVLPQQRAFLAEHSHYAVPLACEPAGEGVVADGRQLIVGADPTKKGWLPANHPSFAGRAPAGAVFGYNLAADARLAALWPPAPPSAAAFFRDRGEGHVGGTLLPQGPQGVVQADAGGIWWNSDCLGDAPWAPGGDGSSDTSLEAGVPCSRPERLAITLFLSLPAYDNAETAVTSLRPAAGSPITVVPCTAGGPATTGALLLGFDPEALLAAAPSEGATALKGVEDGRILFGPVCEGLIAGPGITLSSADALPLPGGGTLYRGRVTASSSAGSLELELPPVVMRLLGGATERPAGGLLYTGLPAGRSTGVALKFAVPYQGLGAAPQAALRLTAYAPSAGSVPALSVSVTRLPRPAAGQSAAAAAAADAAIATGQAVPAGQYVELASAPFAVAAGDTVAVTLARAGVGDGYADELGVVRVGLVLLAPEAGHG